MMQSYAPLAVAKTKANQILSGAPESGSISVYAQKLTSLAFVTLCSVVFLGHVGNRAAAYGACHGLCRWHLSLGVLTALYSAMLLIANQLAESRRLSRDGWFSHGREVHLVAFLFVMWIFGVITVSTYEGGDALMRWFAWGAFFGSAYATFKSYHSFKEEDLPTVLPDGFDEEDFVYG